MAVFSTIKLSKLEGAKRIDADYYNPNYLNLLKRLREVGCIPLKQIASPVKRKFEPKDDGYFDYIEIGEIDLLTGEFNTSKIKGDEAPDRAQWSVFEDDVLVSTVRPIRNAVTIIRDNRKHLVSSSGFCIIHSQKIQANYLFIYLKNSFIARLLDRQTTATEYPAVNWNDVLNILIYLGSENFRNKISTIVDKAFELLDRSKISYSKAENLLLEELGLKDYKLNYQKTYIARLSDMVSTHRMDSEYFQPAYEEVIQRLRGKNIELKPLGKFILSIQKGIEPGSENYQDSGMPFIRVSNVSIDGFTHKDQKYLSVELYEQLKEKYKPKLGDLLLTKDATPGIAYVVKEQIEGILSSGILKIQISDSEISKEYLTLCINSLVGRMQMEKDSGGSVILHWKPEQIKKIEIPILPTSFQSEIAYLVQQSHEARRRAEKLLETAKRTIEIAIEKNDDEALHFLNEEYKALQ